MIQITDKPFDDEQSLGVLNPYVREWFGKNFDELTPPQKFSFKLISESRNILITAPTGSGKTMSGFLSIISKLFDYSLAGTLEDRVYCIYVSPLRALNNDIHRNLQRPLEEIYKMVLKKKGVNVIKEGIKNVTIGVRTGDTPQKERAKQLARPPNILVTTPESLAIMINSQRFVESLKGVEFLIVDEIHELANNKRGVHLSLSIERLAAMSDKDFARVGLGATVAPLDEAAKYLVGYRGDELRDCTIVDASWSKKLEVMAMSPAKDLINTPDNVIEDETYKRLNSIIENNRTTLIFTNTRSGTERVVFNLKRRFHYGEDIAAHHGSLSRETRLDVEELLKKGSLKCAVSSTSLELGVDIGTIDNVVQLGSPKSVARAVQRIGRSGHSYKAVARGEMIVLNRDDMVETAIMLDSALKRRIDTFSVPKNPLDVLAQHVVGMSLTKKWNIDEAYDVIRSSYAYHDLPREDFESIVGYLAGDYVGLESRHVYGKIWFDKETQMFGKRGRLAQAIYMLNLGTIPDQVAINVVNVKDKKWIGNIEEEFLSRLKEGDIFTLGGKLYKFEYAKEMKCYVSDANTNAPTIPPWYSEQLPLSFELANQIGEFRSEFADVVRAYIKSNRIKSLVQFDKLPEEIDEYLGRLPVDENSKFAIFGYFLEQILYADLVPNNRLLLIEQSKSLDGKEVYVIFHSLYGRRANDALSRAVAIKLSDMLNREIGLMVNDNGFVLVLDGRVNVTERMVKEIMGSITAKSIEPMLKENIRRTEMMKRRFRYVAGRAFMILRNYKGRRMQVGRQHINAQLLLNAAEEIDPDFPLIKETYREILNEVMDLPRAEQVLRGIKAGEISYKMINTIYPSPFAHNMITFGHADVVLMKERHEYLKSLHKMVLENINRKK
ncbi:MAG: ATP-dependent helicase [Candidatus Micrarchaeota archaeon]|nr:ATP-dependent helicase [Candidatus Micrarchaeota archaeon]